jgi:hypothetical protein
MPVPSLMREVAAATNASHTKGSGSGVSSGAGIRPDGSYG